VKNLIPDKIVPEAFATIKKESISRDFLTLSNELSDTWRRAGITLQPNVQRLLSEMTKLGEYAITFGQRLLSSKSQLTPSFLADRVEYGEIDPCDDTPAFLGLSAVSKAALFLNPSEAIEHRPGIPV